MTTTRATGRITVSWLAPWDDGGAPISGYDVRYKAITAGSWTSAPSVSGTTTTATIDNVTDATAYAVAVRAKNSSGNGNWAQANVAAINDYDADDDGLIEVSSLAQLNAMRWDLDGNGAASSGNATSYAAAFPNAKSNMGCNEDDANPAACSGYELAANLDFDTNDNDSADSGDTYWNGGDGWNPIGTGSAAYTGDFDGNNDSDSSGDGGPYAIANLHINRSAATGQLFVGLFGVIGSGAEIERVALTGVSVTGGITGNANGNDEAYAGALAGRNFGTIANSRSSGAVAAHRGNGGASEDAYAGGLVGGNPGAIRASYSSADVTATADSPVKRSPAVWSRSTNAAGASPPATPPETSPPTGEPRPERPTSSPMPADWSARTKRRISQSRRER